MGEIQRGGQTQQQTAEVPPEACYQEVSSVGTTEKTINFGGSSASILIHNTHPTNNLYVYFKRSKSSWNNDYKTIEAGVPLSIDHRTTAIKGKGQAANTTYEILATLEQVL